MQVGKVPPAITVLRADLGLGIVAAAWVLSLFSVIGAGFGVLAGPISNRFGAHATTIAALLGMAGASAVGARAESAALLLASRAFEGTAFVIAVVAIPSLLAKSAHRDDRDFVAAAWGVYMPIGMAIALTAAPAILLAFGWRTFWDWNAVLLLFVAVGLSVVAKPSAGSGGRPDVTLDGLTRTLKHRDVLLLALIFSCYTLQFLSVLGFLPTILEQQGVSPQGAGTQTAIAVVSNAAGNIAAAYLIARGFAPARLMAFALIVMVVCELGIYASAMPPEGRYGFAIAFSAFGGLLPASIFAVIPSVALRVGTGAVTMALVVQASHIGQTIGPPAVAAVAGATGGWAWSPLVLVPAALFAILASFGLRTDPDRV